MTEQLYIPFYCKLTGDPVVPTAEYIRAYKYIRPLKDKTIQFQHFVYSYKAKRYVVANFYVMDWKGNQRMSVNIDRQTMRGALRRIGLDIR